MNSYLETERLRLRRFTEADVDNLCELDSDPDVMRYLNGGDPTPRAVIEQRILPGFLRSYTARAGYGVWAAEERASGAFIGWFGFRPGADKDGADGADGADFDGDVELGYRLRRAVWRRGYATEGGRALIARGFTELGARRVLATTYQDNLASRRVMEKCGLRLVRSFRPTPDELGASDTFVPGQEVWDGDDVEYALTREEWEQKRHDAGLG